MATSEPVERPSGRHGVRAGPHDRDRALTGMSLQQLGLFTYRQALLAGFPDTTVRDRVRAGAWERWLPHVLGRSGLPRTWRRRLLAAVLSAGRGAAAARGSAARLWDLPTGRENPLEVVVPYSRCVQDPHRSIIVHRSRTLEASDIVTLGSVPVTVADRTIVDLCGERTVDVLSEMMAVGIRRDLMSLASLEEREVRAGRLRGIGRFRAARRRLHPDVARSRAAREIELADALPRAGLPRPVVGHEVFDEQGRLVAEVDLAYVDERLAIEVDGFVWHSSPWQKRYDSDRQNRLVALGWQVLRFSTEEIDARSGQVISRIADVLQTPLV